MERNIYIEPLGKLFAVELKDANRDRRNRSYSNAAPCCSTAENPVKLKQEMQCAQCGNAVDRKGCTHKIVDIAKKSYLISAALLDQVQEQMEMMEKITVQAVLAKEPDGAADRYDSLVYVLPVEKRATEYVELLALLKGRVGVGKGVFRSNEFQILVTVGDDGVIRLRKLVEEQQHNVVSLPELSVQVNQKIIELENAILDRKETVASFDLTQFRDSRVAEEERIIEDVVLHGKVPDVAPMVAMQQRVEADEVERLRVLLEAS
jgi:hypothetical protein